MKRADVTFQTSQRGGQHGRLFFVEDSSVTEVCITDPTADEAHKALPSLLRRRLNLLVALLLAQALVSCRAETGDSSDRKFPDVVAASVQSRSPDTFDFDVTVSSPYDTPQRYADAFHVIGKDGTVFGERILFHDHASEQPFSRDLYSVRIPPGERIVVIQARDRKYGYGGKSVEVVLPGR